LDSAQIAVTSPTPHEMIENLCGDLINEFKCQKNSIVIDIGCGDGRWLKALSAVITTGYCIGVELNDVRLQLARGNCSEVSTEAITIF
jgi:tRNA G46 methylase TrmB